MEQININEEQEYYPAVRVFCPECHWRLIDKLSQSMGRIRMKCPHCSKTVEINLKFRLNRSRIYYELH